MQTPDCDLQNGFTRTVNIEGTTVTCFAKGGWNISSEGANCPWNVRKFPEVFLATGEFKNPNDVAIDFDWVNSNDGRTPRFVTFKATGPLEKECLLLEKRAGCSLATLISGTNHENPFSIINKWGFFDQPGFVETPQEKKIRLMMSKMKSTGFFIRELKKEEGDFFGSDF